MNDIKSILLILVGPPKSGLSVLFTCLGKIGIKPFCGPEDLNHLSAGTIDRLLFQELDRSPNMIGGLPENWISTPPARKTRERIRNLLSHYILKPEIGMIADFTLSRTFPVWGGVCEELNIEPRVIAMIRHPWEVAQSLAVDGNMDLSDGHLLWLGYIRDAMRICQNRSAAVVTIDQLLADPVTTLVHIGQNLSLRWPITPWSVTTELLNHVQPGLKHHRTADLSDMDQQLYRSYEQLYQKIRFDQLSSLASASSITLETTFNPKYKATQPDQYPVSKVPDLIDSLLAGIGRYEKLTGTRSVQQQRITDHVDTALYAQIVFPSSRKSGEVAETIPLIADEWHKISLAVPEPALLKDNPVIIRPLNTRGTVLISYIKLLNRSNGNTLWAANTPQDYDSLVFNDHLHRITDLENLVLLIIGEKPQIDVPCMKNQHDGPVEIVLWLKASKDQQVMHRSNLTAKSRKHGVSNLIWLASYPRSGNTMLRIMLRHYFGLKSYSIYNDTLDIGKYIEISEIVGHQFMHWPSIVGQENPTSLNSDKFNLFDPLRYKARNLKLVKTHSSWNVGFKPDKTIYIYRDGRSALRSYASYKHDFTNSKMSLVSCQH